MKIPVLFLLVLSLFSPSLLKAGAAPFDASAITESSYARNGLITFNESDSGLYVYSGYSAEDLSFIHSRESDAYYSYADFDMYIEDYQTESEQPYLRLWFTLWTPDQSYDVSSVTLTVRGQDYTFSDIANSTSEKEGQFKQDLLILFDADNYSFLYQLHQLRELGKASADWAGATIHTVFHGTEDITAEIGENLWPVFDVFWDLYLSSSASVHTLGIEGTPMETGSP